MVRRQNSTISQWLREADGSKVKQENKESGARIFNFGGGSDSGQKWGKTIRDYVQNPNLIPFGFRNHKLNAEKIPLPNPTHMKHVKPTRDSDPLILTLKNEDNPLNVVEGKK